VNQPFASPKFDALLERVLAHMRERDLFVQDLVCGADPLPAAHPRHRRIRLARAVCAPAFRAARAAELATHQPNLP
jgi:ATP-dependent phosphoenolpyruvate carboxykinase